jgi:hypothetical protein
MAGRFRPTAYAFLCLLIALLVVPALFALFEQAPDSPPANSGPTPSELLACEPASGADSWLRTAVRLAEVGESARAEEIYRAVLAEDATNECAVRGLAALSVGPTSEPEDKSPSQQVGDSWSSVLERHFSPLGAPLLVALAVLLLLLVFGRLATPWAVSPEDRSWGSSGQRRGLLVLAVVLIFIAASTPVAAGLVQSSSTGAVLPLICLLLVAWLLLDLAGRLHSRLREDERACADRGPLAGYRFLGGSCVGAGCLALVSGLVLLGIVAMDQQVDWDVLLLLSGMAAVLGIALLAAIRGQALRMLVEVWGTAGSIDASAGQYLVSRLGALGTSPPAGLEVPQQTDVTALPADALTTLPEAAFAKALFRVLQAVRPAAPYQATVAVVDTSTVTIALVRNGRNAEPITTLTRAELSLPPLPKEITATDKRLVDDATKHLITAAAAHILLALSKRHRELEPGLCGATRSPSLAMHAIATDPAQAVGATLQSQLIAAAVADNPSNGLARTADLGRLGRLPTFEDQSELVDATSIEYLRVRDRAGCESLALRLLFTQAAARLNIVLLYRRDQMDAAVLAVSALVDALHLPAPILVDTPLVQEMRVAVAYLALGLDDKLELALRERETWFGKLGIAKSWMPPKLTPLTAATAYSRACWRCQTGPTSSAGSKWQEETLADLRIAVTKEAIRRWAQVDPSFDNLRTPHDRWTAHFKVLVGDPLSTTSFLDVPPLKNHKAQLESLGVEGPADLLAVSPYLAAVRYGIAPAIMRRWREIARLAMDQGGARAVPPTLLAVLINLGVSSRSDLRTRVQSDKAAWHERVLSATANLPIMVKDSDWDAYIG